MLRFVDDKQRDITHLYDCPSQFCENPSCLGEPWCSAWGVCAQEPSQTGTARMENVLDDLFLELSQQLGTQFDQPHPLQIAGSTELIAEPHCSTTTLTGKTSSNHPLLSSSTPQSSNSRFAELKVCRGTNSGSSAKMQFPRGPGRIPNTALDCGIHGGSTEIALALKYHCYWRWTQRLRSIG